ncbi:hypothetical protein LTS07_005185 [Exophiala sideris]|uniref:Fe/B12 periplasmic-binding domain-containing protein n=1 Tax=Exophiala sideris TaxID=1016849 RepID=A0ABR0JAX6_9EURO|nr:hypothetical protein LTS07_005185 [Exophiala sideris]KAK5038454.1 hypothetical protein LTR13_004201 [Exophiala sideris]KAK5060337.1 hypothetical protein LTR69_005654 [Exophiala sideris]KAK5183247.1 hypothetical protein LTR44_004248 [Eurotiomycetes sp. CCFEE 6388]
MQEAKSQCLFLAIETLDVVLEALVVAPKLMICSSQWTTEEQERANKVATKIIPDIKFVNSPPGLDVREGGDAIVKFLHSAVKTSGVSKSV